MLGTAMLVLQSPLSIAEVKNLTPMETVDEVFLARLFREDAAGGKEKIDKLQLKIFAQENELG
jgi:hypothetical protein